MVAARANRERPQRNAEAPAADRVPRKKGRMFMRPFLFYDSDFYAAVVQLALA